MSDENHQNRIAIIGAGISGITLAKNLSDFGQVTVFEKSRGVGGRMSTRYVEVFSFDHGNQHFTARTKEFQDFLKPFLETGVVAEWSGKVITLELGKKMTKRLWFEPHFVAAPTMNGLCKKLSEQLTIILNKEIVPIHQKKEDGWHLYSKEGEFLGVFDWVISTAPSEQTKNLMGAYLQNETSVSLSKMNACYALMIGFKKKWNHNWIAAKVLNNTLDWISINSTKPGRNKDVTAIVCHSTKDWANAHVDDDIKEVEKFLINEFEALTGISCSEADSISTHRWRYATSETIQDFGFFLDEKNGLAATGDWASASQIEEVWRSATNLANQIRFTSKENLKGFKT